MKNMDLIEFLFLRDTSAQCLILYTALSKVLTVVEVNTTWTPVTLLSQMWSRAFHLNSCSYSHFVTYKVGTSGECQLCVTREEDSHPCYAPSVAVLLIR